MSHRTTWTGPERTKKFKDKNVEVRRNSFRDQNLLHPDEKNETYLLKGIRAFMEELA